MDAEKPLGQELAESQIESYETSARSRRKYSRWMFGGAATGILGGLTLLALHGKPEKVEVGDIVSAIVDVGVVATGVYALTSGIRMRNEAGVHERSAALLGQELVIERGLQQPPAAQPPTLPPTPPTV